jgi:hypothetical protein
VADLGYWSTFISIKDVELHNVHPQILALDEDGELYPTEFREGPSRTENAHRDFFRDFANHLRKRSLENTFWLQVV